jgi:hypothetical protein
MFSFAAVQEFSAVSRCMTFIGFLTANHGFIRRCFFGAIGEMSFKPQHRATAVTALGAVPAARLPGPGASVEDQTPMQVWFENVDWHKMLGKRVHHIKKDLMTAAGQLHCIFVSFVTSWVFEIPYFRANDCSQVPPNCSAAEIRLHDVRVQVIT